MMEVGTPVNSDSGYRLILQEEAPVPDRIKYDLGPIAWYVPLLGTDVYVTLRSLIGMTQ